MGSTQSPNAGMHELNTGQKHPLSGADPESYTDPHPLDSSQKEMVTAGTWCSITRLTPGRWGSIALIGCPSRRGNSDNSVMIHVVRTDCVDVEGM